MRSRRWWLWLGLIAAAGLALRIAYVLITKNPRAVGGDSFYYHYGANLLVEGRGFPDPIQLLQFHRETPGAAHPPGYILALAIPSLFRLDTFLAHQIWSCIIGGATVMLVGVTGKEIAGPRVGLVAAVLAAVYPSVWFYDSVVMSVARRAARAVAARRRPSPETRAARDRDGRDPRHRRAMGRVQPRALRGPGVPVEQPRADPPVRQL